MSKESRTADVDEDFIKRVMAGQASLHQGIATSVKQDEPEGATLPAQEKETKKRKKNQPDFVELFLEPRRFGVRQQVYISKDTFELVSKYLSVIGERKVSITAYIENIILHHIQTNKDVINELYNGKMGSLFQE